MKKIENKKGVVLPIALFILLGTLISTMLLIKSTENSLKIADSISSKTKSNNSNEEIINKAESWLLENINNLDNDVENSGYY